MRVLLTGGSGQLGKEIFYLKPKEIEIFKPSKLELNLLSKDSCLEAILKYKPDWIINCAAYTNVDKAEFEKDLVFKINSLAPKYFAEAIKKYGGNFLHISTDYVFDGLKGRPYKPNDQKSPINNYGYTKAKGEDFITELLSDSNKVNIIRTSWLMSPYGKNFALTIIKKLSEVKELKIISDQVGSPTTTSILAKACWQTIILKSQGCEIPKIMHCTNSGVGSWYDIASSLEEIGIKLNLIENQVNILPIKSEEYPTSAKRPFYSVLDCSDSLKKLSIKPINWRSAIFKLLTQLKNERLT